MITTMPSWLTSRCVGPGQPLSIPWAKSSALTIRTRACRSSPATHAKGWPAAGPLGPATQIFNRVHLRHQAVHQPLSDVRLIRLAANLEPELPADRVGVLQYRDRVEITGGQLDEVAELGADAVLVGDRRGGDHTGIPTNAELFPVAGRKCIGNRLVLAGSGCTIGISQREEGNRRGGCVSQPVRGNAVERVGRKLLSEGGLHQRQTVHRRHLDSWR